MRNALIGLLLLVFSTLGLGAQERAEAVALVAAMDAVSAGKWRNAAALVEPAGQVGRDIVDWYRLRAGAGDFAEYVEFLDRRGDWPGLPLMRRSGEVNILAPPMRMR